MWWTMASLLKKQRLGQGLTQTELAKRVGTSQAQIYRLENSERKLTVEWAERLAGALSTTAEALLFGATPIHLTTPPVTSGTIPGEAHKIIAECLAFIDALESRSNRVLTHDEQAAYLIKFYNIYQETGQLPCELDNIRVASVASIVCAKDFPGRQAKGNKPTDRTGTASPID